MGFEKRAELTIKIWSVLMIGVGLDHALRGERVRGLLVGQCCTLRRGGHYNDRVYVEVGRL